MRIALKFAYLGTDYYGYQIQPGVPTIEGKLLKALKDGGVFRNPSRARYSVAGRTDRGVHALGQVIAFDTDDPGAVSPTTINGLLHHIWIYATAEVGKDFNARTSAAGRKYCLFFWGKGLDIEKMKETASLFHGRHDFRNFADEETGKSTVCNITDILISEESGWFSLHIAADRFLQHMVRKIAASIILNGKGEKDKDRVKNMLEGSKREKLEPADARGLILMNVTYPGVMWRIDDYARSRALEEIHELFLNHETASRILGEIEKRI